MEVAMRSILILVTCVFCAAAAAGDVYKWVDKDGRTHYGDKPKQGGEEVELHGTGGNGPPSTDPVAANAQAARDAECQRKKSQLAAYAKAPSINETDNLGRTRAYTEEEKTQFLDRFQKQVDIACAPPAPAQ
jgi:hypothetical protein